MAGGSDSPARLPSDCLGLRHPGPSVPSGRGRPEGRFPHDPRTGAAACSPRAPGQGPIWAGPPFPHSGGRGRGSAERREGGVCFMVVVGGEQCAGVQPVLGDCRAAAVHRHASSARSWHSPRAGRRVPAVIWCAHWYVRSRKNNVMIAGGAHVARATRPKPQDLFPSPYGHAGYVRSL